jgi:hypothetical protein
MSQLINRYRRTLLLSVTGLLLLAALLVYRNQSYASTASATATIYSLLYRALVFQKKGGSPSLAEIPLGQSISISQRGVFLKQVEQTLLTMYTPNSPELARELTGIQAGLAGLEQARRVDGGINHLQLTSLALTGNQAVVTWTAQSWATVILRQHSGAWGKPVTSTAGIEGTAILTNENGHWLISNLSGTYTPGQGGP